MNEPLFSECYFDTDLVKRWEEYEGEGETIRTVWGHVKDYLELVDYLLGDDSNDEWNVIMAELDVDDDTEYPTRDSFMAEWIEIHLSADPRCMAHAMTVLEHGQILRRRTVAEGKNAAMLENA